VAGGGRLRVSCGGAPPKAHPAAALHRPRRFGVLVSSSVTSDPNTEADAAEGAPTFTTRRPTVPALEEWIARDIPCLDHGYVRLVDYMGDDQAIVQAARVSYQTGTKRVREDRGLIRYLLRHRHTTPFEMCEIKVHMKLPIFVARQLVRSRTANLNETSGRYSILDKEFYIPDASVLGVQSKSNRQGRGEPVSPERAAQILEILKRDAETNYAHYVDMLGGEAAVDSTGEQREAKGEASEGLARELARINLPLSFYTQWYWKIDLHNLLRFISLRIDPHAQYEIRVYAEALARLARLWVPVAYEAFEDYQLHGANLSRMETEALKALVRGETPDYAALGMSAREQTEFKARFGIV
jgi:thymidylate synthase (FAD)